MRFVVPILLLLMVAACTNRQVPKINGVPVTGEGVGTGGGVGGVGR